MDIVEFLLNDHRRMRTELKEIPKTAAEGPLRRKIRQHISHFELHESVEDRFMERLKKLPGYTVSEQFLGEFEKNHEQLWKLLDKLQDAVNKKDAAAIHKAALNFRVVSEAHMA